MLDLILNRKSECCILMSWQVVHIDDKFHTQVDTFSNVNVLQRNKMHSNDGNNGSEGECFASSGSKPLALHIYRCKVMHSTERSNYSRIVKRNDLLGLGGEAIMKRI